MIIGIDEVGRGAWAGPLLVVAAKGVPPQAVFDSKQLTKKSREQLAVLIDKTCELGMGWVSSQEVDRFGLAESMRLAVSRALDSIGATKEDEIIIDGSINYCPPSYTNTSAVVKADSSVSIVSAASIVAKVVRDKKMVEIAKKHPQYAFEKHVGYGTSLHRERLKEYGPCDEHRMSFKPLLQFS